VKGEALINSQGFAIMQTKLEAELTRKTEELKRKEEDFAILQRKFGDIRDELKKNDEEVKDQYQKDFQTLMLEKNGLENALVQETKELQASRMRMNIAELNSKKDRVENERLEGGVSKYLA
jgi:ribosomal protein L32E